MPAAVEPYRAEMGRFRGFSTVGLVASRLLKSRAQGESNAYSDTEGLHADRAADRGRDHRYYRSHRGAGSASRPYVGQRGVGHRIDARDQHGAAELLAAVQ